MASDFRQFTLNEEETSKKPRDFNKLTKKQQEKWLADSANRQQAEQEEWRRKDNAHRLTLAGARRTDAEKDALSHLSRRPDDQSGGPEASMTVGQSNPDDEEQGYTTPDEEVTSIPGQVSV